MRSKLDLARLRIEIQDMSLESNLYQVLKEELTKRGYWKALKRGKPNPMFMRRGNA